MSAPNRPACPYDTDCYRRNPMHLTSCSHSHLDQLLPEFMSDPNFRLSAEKIQRFRIEEPEIVLEQLDILKITQAFDIPSTTTSLDKSTAAKKATGNSYLVTPTTARTMRATDPDRPLVISGSTGLHTLGASDFAFTRTSGSDERCSVSGKASPIGRASSSHPQSAVFNNSTVTGKATTKTNLANSISVPSPMETSDATSFQYLAAKRSAASSSQSQLAVVFKNATVPGKATAKTTAANSISVPSPMETRDATSFQYLAEKRSAACSSQSQLAVVFKNATVPGKATAKTTAANSISVPSPMETRDATSFQYLGANRAAGTYSPESSKRIAASVSSKQQPSVNRTNHGVQSASLSQFVAESNNTVLPEKAAGKHAFAPLGWKRGKLCPINKPNAYFIKPELPLPEGYTQKDVFMNPEKVSSFLLPLKTGDELEFVLGNRDKTKPMARKVRVVHYSYRTNTELYDYFNTFLEVLQSTNCNQALADTLPNKALWRLLGSVNFSGQKNSEAYVFSLLLLLTQILKGGKLFRTLVADMMNIVLQGTLFQSTSKSGLPNMIKSCHMDSIVDELIGTESQKSIFEFVSTFCHEAVKMVPAVGRNILPIVLAISETPPTAKTQHFLYELLKTTVMSGKSCGLDLEYAQWQELPLVPTSHELMGGLVEEDKHLSCVKIEHPYESSEDYMDTYFRLLRAETFSAIQHGIKDLKANRLDLRDMNVYHNVYLAGYEISNSKFSLAIQFQPAKPVKKWEVSPQLMFGNLLCISLNRKFDDVIWATVSDRNLMLLKKSQIIIVELIDYNTKSTSQIMASLQAHGGTTIMVESPTYFHALRPILSSLQAFDVETFPLQQEIVKMRHQPDLPSYIDFATTLNTSSVARASESRSFYPDEEVNFGAEMNVKAFLQTFTSSSNTTLEASQCRALIHALRSRLAIIQGPPGCGKTFLGVKIVQLLLSLKPMLTKPILLLTYKNHALDEFLKLMLEFCNKNDIVRIGGRSKEPELETCNLQFIMKNERISNAQYAEIQESRNEIEELTSQIGNLSSAVDSSCYFTRKTLIDALSDDQIESLLVEAGWNKRDRVYQVNGKTFADKGWVLKLLLGIEKEFGSLKTFLLLCTLSGVPNNNHNVVHCYTLFDQALKMWFPDKFELEKLKRFQAQFLQAQSTKDEEEDESDKKKRNEANETDDDGDFDEEYINEMQEARMAAMGREKQGERQRGNLVIFDAVRKNSPDILIKLSNYPANMEASPTILLVKNVWALNEIERMQLIYSLLKEKASKVSKELDELLQQLEKVQNRKRELETQQKVGLLSKKKIIGVTITGASIHHDIIHHIGPNVVIVEEAAEILEPSLLAALTPDIEQLVLIGDHQQLRPQVDTYKLRTKYKLDVSLMERLIHSNFPYETLTKQNRMRPEFSVLLHDIYPYLEDNLKRVTGNAPLKCLEKSMFFWSHNDPEVKSRTFTNAKEAERIVALVLYLLSNGCKPSEITVLSAYLGQTKLLRGKLRDEKSRRPQLFQTQDSEGFIQVQTIDMFQGDENKYILVSLVRSNPEGNIGFLKDISRRCVAQSRAKCGMYFVGNEDTLTAKKTCWSVLIGRMAQQKCVGHSLTLQCCKHKELSRYQAADAQSLMTVVDDPSSMCKQRCGDQLPCNIPGHLCKKPCAPKHSHPNCTEVVEDIFPQCRHPVTRRCYEKMSDLRCNKKVSFVFARCGHPGIKNCWQAEINQVCKEPCPTKMPCIQHKCPDKCGSKHSHEKCLEKIKFTFLFCNHEAERKCWETIESQSCNVKVDITLSRCGHQNKKRCHEKIDDVSCIHPCKKLKTCGKHNCTEVCGKAHDHINCQTMTDYSFPGCDHPSPKRKKCSEVITWKCTSKVYVKGTCLHDIMKECHQKISEVKCQVKSCGKIRNCGHPCTNICGEDCNKGDCKFCKDEFERTMKSFHDKAKKRVKELENVIRNKAVPSFSRDTINKTGDTAAEYQRVVDQVIKYIQPSHNWYPTVTKIEKVSNLDLEKKFEVAKSRAFGDYIDTKFHGTDDAGVIGITNNGFRMPNPQPPLGQSRGMYGQGIYFATDSSKSAQDIYTKGSGKLLLCQVILGKSKTVLQPDYNLCDTKMRSKGYDSVYAPRNTAVKNDEFVIFNPDQALPQYIIHYSTTGVVPPPQTVLPPSQKFIMQNMVASRNVDLKDPFETYYRLAEWHFMRMKGMRGQVSVLIKSIDIVINKDLQDNFEAQQRSFKASGIPDAEILAYHGTNVTNIDSILRNNLQVSHARRQAHGKGNYFSEFPDISIGYGNGLLLCRVLPGREYVGGGNIPPSYNSKKVLGNHAVSQGANASGDMIIIENTNQILPFFVIHL